jgi:hypothetical protein
MAELAESLAVFVSAVSAVDKLSELMRFLDQNFQGSEYASVFGELEILQAILSESALLLHSSHSTVPKSALVALKRCISIEVSLLDIAKKLGLEERADSKATSRLKFRQLAVFSAEKLRTTMDTFKSSILLFRDIATE